MKYLAKSNVKFKGKINAEGTILQMPEDVAKQGVESGALELIEEKPEEDPSKPKGSKGK